MYFPPNTLQTQKYSGLFSLDDLTLSPNTVIEGSAQGTLIGNLIGGKPGSSYSLQDDDGTRVQVDEDMIEVGAVLPDAGIATPRSFTVRETNLAAEGSTTHDTVLEYNVADDDGTDPYWANVVLLGSGNGAQDSTVFADESPVARGNATVVGNARVDTAIKKFGTGSLNLDGNGDWIEWADSEDWNFGAGDFTLDIWFLTNSAANQSLMAQYLNTGSQRGIHWWLSGGLMAFAWNYTGGSSGGDNLYPDDRLYAAIPGGYSGTGWRLASVSRNGDVMRTFIDGAMIGKKTIQHPLDAIHNSNQPWRIGRWGSTSTIIDEFNGRFDEWRVTKGVGRYASDDGFDLPTTPWPRG